MSEQPQTPKPGPLVLPAKCPLCPTVLQQALNPRDGVRPHFDVMHPGQPVPDAYPG